MDRDIVDVLLKLLLDQLHRVLAHDFTVLFTKIADYKDSVHHLFHEEPELSYNSFDPSVIKDSPSLPVVFLVT